jgi:hypothetical protein
VISTSASAKPKGGGAFVVEQISYDEIAEIRTDLPPSSVMDRIRWSFEIGHEKLFYQES